MEKDTILPLSQVRLINLATYLVVVVIGVLGVGGLTPLWSRLAFIGLCLSFALVYLSPFIAKILPAGRTDISRCSPSCSWG